MDPIPIAEFGRALSREIGRVIVEGQTNFLPRPFLVAATQNPVELEGTFPLPEAQLDRFLLRITVGYPSETEEVQILRRFETATPLDDVQPIVTASDILSLIDQARHVYLDDSIAEYIVAIARATRSHEAIELGASPRASLALFHASQALAALRGRAYVLPDDVKQLTAPVFGHRLILRHQGRLRGSDVQHVLDSIVEVVPTPVEPVPRPA